MYGAMMIDEKLLAKKAYNMRVSSVEMTTRAGSGHPTSSLSAADIMSALFFHAMRFNVHEPKNPCNDRFVLSKGHAAPILYAAYKELGVLSHKDLMASRTFNSVLEGHPTPRFPWVDAATGSLGMGLSIACGMAYHAKMRELPYYTYVLLGDSELAEGSVWEAVEIATHYCLDNMIAIVDVNRLGQRGETIDGHDLERIAQKFISFGWHAAIVDGHSVSSLAQTFDDMRSQKNGKPHVVLARTIKGFGVSSVEDKNGFHGKPFAPEQLEAVKLELKQRFYQKDWDHTSDMYTLSAPPVCVGVEDFIVSIPEPQYRIGDMIATREACGDGLVALAKRSDAVVCLDAEVSNSTCTEKFKEAFPNRFIECFIAEQNMVGMAIGCAARRNITFMATFGAFFTRAFDQLRMAAISRVAIRAIGSHAGVSIGEDGPSQMALEDIAMFRLLPNSIILYPCDAVSCYKQLGLVANYSYGISYVRTTRGKTPVIYAPHTQFVVGGFHVLRQSEEDQAVIIAAGITVYEALKAYEIVRGTMPVAVIDLYGIKPLDAVRLRAFVAQHGNKVITVEDHYLQGGIGEAVAYALRNSRSHTTSLAVRDIPRSGSTQELLSWAGIDADAIVKVLQKPQ
jgi:transketolase